MEKKQGLSIKIKRGITGQTQVESFWIENTFHLGSSDDIPYLGFDCPDIISKYKVSPTAFNILNQFYQKEILFSSIMIRPSVIYIEKKTAEDSEVNEKEWEIVENELIGIICNVLGEKGEKM